MIENAEMGSVFRNLVLFVHFWESEKCPWRSLTFSKANACKFTKSKISPWMFFSFFKLCKCYQIAQSVSIGSHHEKAYVTNPLNKRKERANFCRFLCNASKILRFLFSIAPGNIARPLVFSVCFFWRGFFHDIMKWF